MSGEGSRGPKVTEESLPHEGHDSNNPDQPRKRTPRSDLPPNEGGFPRSHIQYLPFSKYLEQIVHLKKSKKHIYNILTQLWCSG